MPEKGALLRAFPTVIDGIECWAVGENAYFAAAAWAPDEAVEYMRTGDYPERLLKLIREQQGRADERA